MRTHQVGLALAVTAAVAGSTSAEAAFDIQVNYSGDAQYQAAFDNAESIWEGLISGYQNGKVVARTSGSSYDVGDTVNTLFIDAVIASIDGPGEVLGSAGWNQRVVDEAGFSLATNGSMTFDSADIAGFSESDLEALILHEMAHVMGFGTMWSLNGVYTSGSGEYTGTHATLARQTEFGQTGTPDVELAGGPGTANAHWNEVDNGVANVGITDTQGRDIRYELMTGWFNPGGPGYFISDMTVASFVDIGYTAVIPEPASIMMLAISGALLLSQRRRV